jgi:heptosyltransferase-2
MIYKGWSVLADLRHILIIRLSSLGDIVLTTPVLRLIRDHCPLARIDFLMKREYQDVLQTHPCVDRLLLVDSRQSWWTTLRTLRQTRYDLVLDLHGTLRSQVLAWGLVTRRRLVYGKHILRRALLVHVGWNTLSAMTAVPELYAAPLRRLGLQAPLPGLALSVDVESHDAMQQYLTQTFPAGIDHPLLAVAPGARWPTKRWSVDGFARVAEKFARQYQAAVVVLGDVTDAPLAQALCQRLTTPVLNSAGQLTLRHTLALLQRCRLLLCNDSGLMHVATALNIPVVAIFGPTVQEFGFYPFRAQAHVVSRVLPCRPCSTKGSRSCPRGHHACMQEVSSQDVFAAAQRLWDGE